MREVAGDESNGLGDFDVAFAILLLQSNGIEEEQQGEHETQIDALLRLRVCAYPPPTPCFSIERRGSCAKFASL